MRLLFTYRLSITFFVSTVNARVLINDICSYIITFVCTILHLSLAALLYGFTFGSFLLPFLKPLIYTFPYNSINYGAQRNTD